ncbi:hypothetical protein J2X04_002384 [Lysobacter niabensis]|uniref:Uncharacterized protein n=1 Tax=Agrilutibacter niabensis TaxID=380628 RepID=A0ABU1VSC0_9GAMM|nr:hypothetical protein [Lysobacter niabensis]MDR7100003.1 hypothetical protein [Lysobacter niabensis]
MRWPAFLAAVTFAMSAHAQTKPITVAPSKLTLEPIAGNAPLGPEPGETRDRARWQPGDLLRDPLSDAY